MNKYTLAIVSLSVLIDSTAYALSSSVVVSPTCALSVSPIPIELLKTTPITITWDSTGGDTATLKVDAFSQSNIYSTTGLSGSITIPVRASLGLAATLTITRNSPFGTAICKTHIPTFWIPK